MSKIHVFATYCEGVTKKGANASSINIIQLNNLSELFLWIGHGTKENKKKSNRIYNTYIASNKFGITYLYICFLISENQYGFDIYIYIYI